MSELAVDGLASRWPTTVSLTVPVHRNLQTGEWSIVFPSVVYKGFGPEREAIIKADVLPVEIKVIP